MTPSAQGLIERLEGRVALFDHKLDEATDSYSRGLYAGWRAATEEAIRNIEDAIGRVEAEAFLIPEVEELAGHTVGACVDPRCCGFVA